MKRIHLLGLPLVIAVLAASTPSAFGSGFAVIEQSARSIGMANSNGATIDDDPTAIYFNPAGIGWIEGTEVSLGAHIVSPKFTFSDKGSTPVGGGMGGDAGPTAYVPSLYAGHKLNDKVALGIGLFSPFGLTTEYDSNWIGRFSALKSEVMTANVNPTAAVKVNERLSVGAGVSAQYVEAELTQALSPMAPGAVGKIEGDDYGYGFNLGAQYAVTDQTMAGVSYRSTIDHELEGDANFSGLMPKSDVKADLETPDTLSFGLSQKISDVWKVYADVTWTGWSSFDELRVRYEDGRPDTVTPENWDDTWRYSIGTEYAFCEKWTARFGLAYDETPVPDSKHRTARIPDADRTWLALGLGYQPTTSWDLDAGFMYVLFNDSQIDHTYAQGASLVGEFEGEAIVFGLQARYRF